MILCVNLNAAIDKTVIIDSFQLGSIHRPQAVHSLPGGKGCNVARALQRLGEQPVVTGWVGGAAGQFINQGLQLEGIQTDFVYVNAESRTCLSILDSANQLITEIYEKGDPILLQEAETLLDHFRETVGAYTAVTLSGSLPVGVPSDFYARLIEVARQANVPVFLDSSKEALFLGAAARPFLIKPNEIEVEVLVERPLLTREDFATAALEIASRYHTNVALSLGRDGVLVSDGQTAVHLQSPPVEAISAVGSGDCMLAGLAYGFTHGLDLVEAARVGVAAGAANTLVVGAGRFTQHDYDHIHARIVIS